MKGLITKVSAALLVGWYIMSIVGFGVHTCLGSGKSFVVAFYEGVTCEEIHQDHHCEPAACCGAAHHESHEHACCSPHHDSPAEPAGHEDCQFCDGTTIMPASCCSNDYLALELTGILTSDDNRSNDQHNSWLCPCFDMLTCDAGCQTSWKTIIKYIHEPDSGHELLRDRQAVLSVWRI